MFGKIAFGAPGQAWVRRKSCSSQAGLKLHIGTQRVRIPSGKEDHQPEASLARSTGDRGCEA